MPKLQRLICALVALVGFAAVAVAATVNGGTLTVSQGPIMVRPDKTTDVTLFYANAAGKIVHARTLTVDAACTAVTDQFGTVVANPAPAALCTAISSFTSSITTIVNNGAAAGKLDI